MEKKRKSRNQSLTISLEKQRKNSKSIELPEKKEKKRIRWNIDELD